MRHSFFILDIVYYKITSEILDRKALYCIYYSYYNIITKIV